RCPLLALTRKGGTTMPLRLNVGLSRKVGEANYGSRGASINVDMEIDSALVSEPAKLQERIRQLFILVRTSLTEELNSGNPGHPGATHAPGEYQDNGSANGGHGDGHGHHRTQKSP